MGRAVIDHLYDLLSELIERNGFPQCLGSLDIAADIFSHLVLLVHVPHVGEEYRASFQAVLYHAVQAIPHVVHARWSGCSRRLEISETLFLLARGSIHLIRHCFQLKEKTEFGLSWVERDGRGRWAGLPCRPSRALSYSAQAMFEHTLR